MPLPRWLAQINKHTFNPLAIRRGKRPVLTHVGRRSGKTYRTPLDAHPVDGGYVFIANYGSESDWVQNIMASGEAVLMDGGREVRLGNPRLLDREESETLLPESLTLPNFVSVCLRMDRRDGFAGQS